MILAFAVAAAGSAAAPRFALLDRDRYVDNALRVPGRTGGQLLRALCFRPPPECEAGSSACSVAPEYPTIDTDYEIRLHRIGGKGRYQVTSVRVAAKHRLRYQPVRGGHIQRWNRFPEGSEDRRLVVEYLKEHGGAAANRRLEALDRFTEEVRWHEEQHVRHFIGYLGAYERIVNDPRGYPRIVTAANAATARQRIEAAIERNRDRRLRRVARHLGQCVREFHRREDQPETYASLVGECACYGGTACAKPFPPFPPPDFPCSFDAR